MNHAHKKTVYRLALVTVLIYICAVLSCISFAGTRFLVIPFLKAADSGALWANTLIWGGMIGVLVLLGRGAIR